MLQVMQNRAVKFKKPFSIFLEAFLLSRCIFLQLGFGKPKLNIALGKIEGRCLASIASVDRISRLVEASCMFCIHLFPIMNHVWPRIVLQAQYSSAKISEVKALIGNQRSGV